MKRPVEEVTKDIKDTVKALNMLLAELPGDVKVEVSNWGINVLGRQQELQSVRIDMYKMYQL